MTKNKEVVDEIVKEVNTNKGKLTIAIAIIVGVTIGALVSRYDIFDKTNRESVIVQEVVEDRNGDTVIISEKGNVYRIDEVTEKTPKKDDRVLLAPHNYKIEK